MVTRKVIRNKWISSNTLTWKGWISEATEMIQLKKAAFRLQNNEAEYDETWAPVGKVPHVNRREGEGKIFFVSISIAVLQLVSWLFFGSSSDLS